MVEQATTSKIRDYIEISSKLKQLGDEVEALSEKKNALERELVEELAVGGVDNVRLDGVTVYRWSTLRSNIKSGQKEAAIEALRSLGYGDIVKEEVTVNANTLAAVIREIALDGTKVYDVDRIPPELRERLNIFEEHRLKVQGLK